MLPVTARSRRFMQRPGFAWAWSATSIPTANATTSTCGRCCFRRERPFLSRFVSGNGLCLSAQPLPRKHLTRFLERPESAQLEAPGGRQRLCACASDVVRIIQDKVITVGDAEVKLLVEDLGGRRRRVSGGIDIEAACDRVWHVLTQYSLMAQYMPNITKSEVEMRDGEIYLDQIGVISRRLGLKSRMVMRVSENNPEHISFSRVEGRDFSEFEGRYIFRPQGNSMTRLDYEVFAVPMPLFPVALVERKIVKEIPGMLAAVRTESLHGRVVALQEVV